jgi:hypothetical protein
MTVEADDQEVRQTFTSLLGPLSVERQRALVSWLMDTYGYASEGNDPDPVESATSFLDRKQPPTLMARMVCLVYWVQVLNERPSATIRELNDLNRDAGGRRFSDASSMAQSAIDPKGWLVRSEPGHLQLTRRGRRYAEKLPEESSAAGTNTDTAQD